MTDFWDVDALLAEPEEEEKDVKVVSELMRSLKLAEDMQKDDVLSQMDDETLQMLAEKALAVKQLGDGGDDSD